MLFWPVQNPRYVVVAWYGKVNELSRVWSSGISLLLLDSINGGHCESEGWQINSIFPWLLMSKRNLSWLLFFTGWCPSWLKDLYHRQRVNHLGNHCNFHPSLNHLLLMNTISLCFLKPWISDTTWRIRMQRHTGSNTAKYIRNGFVRATFPLFCPLQNTSQRIHLNKNTVNSFHF